MSGAVATRPSRGDLGLKLLEAHSEIGVTLILAAVLVLGALHVIAAFPVQQFSVDILQRVQLQLEITRGLGSLNP